jgi:hypothetical protein
MTNKEWSDWLEKHASVFGLNSTADVTMLESWREWFSRAGYTISELEAATMEMMGTPPQWRTEHLGRINTFIRAERFRTRLALEKMEEERHRAVACQLCGGCGYAEVPHLSCVFDGRWREGPRYTMSVCCRCEIGRRKNEAVVNNPRQPAIDQRRRMGLGEYSMHLPNWENLMREKKEELAARARSHAASAGVDQEFGPLVFRRVLGGVEK